MFEKDQEKNISQIKVEILNKDIHELLIEVEQRRLEFEKKRKRMLIFTSFLLFYIASIIVMAMISIFIPSLKPAASIYLFISNIFSGGLCVYSIISVRKTGLAKERMGQHLIAIGIVCIIINVVVVIHDIIYGIY